MSFCVAIYKKTMDCHAVFAKTARNDGGFCHLEPFVKRRKIHIVILSVSEISTDFKTHFKFKVKNSRFKNANSHFKFVDTSLRSV